VLTANAKSWHRPHVQEIELRAVPDQTARTQGLHAGSIDIALGLAPEDRASVEAEGGRLKATLSPAIEMAAFITATPGPVQDVRVRRALNYAVNKERIIATILGGARNPAAQIANPQAIGFNPALKPYPYDPARAKALLAEAGVAHGFALPTLLAANSNDTYAVYQQIAADLAKVNVTMELQRSTQAKRLEYMYQGGWPVLAFDVSETGFDPLRFYRIRSCAWSHPFQCDHDIMPLIDAATRAANETERSRLTQKVMEYEFKNPPGIFLWQTAQFDGLGPRVKNYNVIADVVQFDDIDLRPNVASRPE
jgi:peptide/nickel transport system substrate-binding protein